MRQRACGWQCLLNVLCFLLIMAGIGGVVELAKGASGGAAHILWVAIFMAVVIAAKAR